MASAYSAPNCPESFVFLSWGSLVHVDNSLSEIVLSSRSIIDTLQIQDTLVGVLLNLGSSETNKFGSYPKADLLWRGFASNSLCFLGYFRHRIIMVDNNYDYLLNCYLILIFPIFNLLILNPFYLYLKLTILALSSLLFWENSLILPALKTESLVNQYMIISHSSIRIGHLISLMSEDTSQSMISNLCVIKMGMIVKFIKSWYLFHILFRDGLIFDIISLI